MVNIWQSYGQYYSGLVFFTHSLAEAYCYSPSSVAVGRSVSLSVTLVSPEKMAVPIEMPFGLRTRVDPGNHVLGPDPSMGRGNFEGERGIPL